VTGALTDADGSAPGAVTAQWRPRLADPHRQQNRIEHE